VHALLGEPDLRQTRRLKTRTQLFTDLILHAIKFLAMLTLQKPKLRKYKNARAELAKTIAEKMTL
jgi:hypothetical protein